MLRPDPPPTTLAGKLGMQAMAEGVETAAELRGLRALQCDVMQGALICEPVPFGELRHFLDTLPGLRRMHVVPGNGGAPTLPAVAAPRGG
ncbi:MAG: EAL domain-containing protein [Burkholderiaceae bacterium]